MTNLELVAMAICREKCAFLGEPACFNCFDEHGNPLPWPAPECDEPGCMALAQAAIDALRDQP
jgi:hypothetical protein